MRQKEEKKNVGRRYDSQSTAARTKEMSKLSAEGLEGFISTILDDSRVSSSSPLEMATRGGNIKTKRKGVSWGAAPPLFF